MVFEKKTVKTEIDEILHELMRHTIRFIFMVIRIQSNRFIYQYIMYYIFVNV